VSAPPPKPRPPLPEGPFLIVGVARSGTSAARLLAGRGEQVRAVDSGHPEGTDRLAEAGVEVNLDVDGTAFLDGVSTVVKSPGVPNDAAVIASARRRGIDVIGELELAWRAMPNRFVGVTGTNGKTTTTELIGELYRAAGEPVAVAGNIGTPLSRLAGQIEEAATVICECSSFQLEDAELFAPECAVFLNLSPDHLDRHPTDVEYLAAKLRIFAQQGNDDIAVFNGDAPALQGIDLGGCARRVRFCVGVDPGCDLSLAEGTIFWDGEPLIEARELSMAGEHNVQNAMAAGAAALAMGLDTDAVREGLRNFPGIPHRLERVAELGGVVFYNDSKATNVSAAVAGLSAFEGGVRVILGGRPKGESFAPLFEPVRDRCSGCYLIGEAAKEIHGALQGAGVPLHLCASLEDAVARAEAEAVPGEVVLLSPACASFDDFIDFEQRGEAFRVTVAGMAVGEQ
jgi:UDP-N-acetylmuramoylalanine--D-glutamate ligase